ncbi:MAG: hypothetical protein H8D92_01290 [Pelagibacteraceae bacterium]|jgi:hypothetical protein|nr:hypothetical protein [Pelagibacteraceae bacterium]
MATTYCSVADVADFLRVSITATSTPNKKQVEKIINRKEEELDRRIGHTFGRNKTVSREIHDLPLLYTYGWGTPVYLKHRNCRDFDTSAGDKIEVWQGADSAYNDIIQDGQWYDFEPTLGRLFFRGYIFTILRKYRIRVTYRYGDATVPLDIEDSCVKLTAIDILNSSFRMDILPLGSNGADIEASKADWRADIENMIDNRQEIFFIP